MKRVYWAILDYDAQQFYGEVVASDGKVFWEADHVIEVADNGSDSLPNIQTLCISCHAKKTKLSAGLRSRPVAPTVASSAEALLSTLADAGMGLRVVGPDRLWLSGLRGDITPAIQSAVRRHKPELVKLLNTIGPLYQAEYLGFVG